jgi:hypothetical protein
MRHIMIIVVASGGMKVRAIPKVPAIMKVIKRVCFVPIRFAMKPAIKQALPSEMDEKITLV